MSGGTEECLHKLKKITRVFRHIKREGSKTKIQCPEVTQSEKCYCFLGRKYTESCHIQSPGQFAIQREALI